MSATRLVLCASILLLSAPSVRRTFLLPVALADAAGESILADVELRCGIQADALACDEVLVDQVVADRRSY